MPTSCKIPKEYPEEHNEYETKFLRRSFLPSFDDNLRNICESHKELRNAVKKRDAVGLDQRVFRHDHDLGEKFIYDAAH